MFPEPVHYMRTDTPGWTIKDWDTANHLLSYLEPEKRHFAVFTLPDDCYIQCLGRKTALTVEARVYENPDSFTHYVFGKGPIVGKQTKVGGTEGEVTIDESQVLQMRDARLIIRQFLETRTFPEHYVRHDITSMFE